MNNHVSEFLQNELGKRQKRNSLFSLRAFAKVLDVSPSQLSQLISGKRPLTKKMAAQISSKLHLSPTEQESFFSELSPVIKSEVEVRRQLKDDEFRLIADWEHFAILSLAKLKRNNYDARWIAKRLNASLKQVSSARDRLLRLGLIEIKGASFIRTSAPLSTSNDVQSSSIKRHHIQNLLLAQEKIETVPVEQREYSSVTVATSPEKIEGAKKMVRQFKRKLSNFLEDGEQTEVYTLSIQLFPLTK